MAVKAPRRDYGAEIDKLTKQVADLTTRNKALLRDNMLLASKPNAPAPAPAPAQRPGIDLRGLPDPVADKDAFLEQLGARVNAFVGGELKHTTTQAAPARDNSWDQLWSDFQAAHPEVAKNRDRVEFIATKLVKEQLRKGIDPRVYAFQNSEDFFADIIEAVNATWPAPAPVVPKPKKKKSMFDFEETEEEDVEEEEEEEEAEEEPNIFTGERPKPRKAPAPDEDESEENSTATAHLRSLQAKSGFF